MSIPYQIIEVANCHGGDINYLMELIKRFEKFSGPYGIKFQPFRYDAIATENYSWYKVYQELYFEPRQWKDIIAAAGKTKDVWIDLFDDYGISILRENLAKVSGIKLQASVLYNFGLLQTLSTVDLSGKKLVINVAAHSLDEVDQALAKVTSLLNPAEVCLEIGFQGYPTPLADSNLSKVKTFKERYSNRLVFAEHVAGDSEDSLWLPVFAALAGVDMLEKHVMLDDRPTKYDHFSSLTPQRYEQYIGNLSKYSTLNAEPYVNTKEAEYLSKSMYIPFLAADKDRGVPLSLDKDLSYRRSDITGLNALQLQKYFANGYVLSRPVAKGSPLRKEDLKKANMAAIVACRLKSSRLKRKAVLNIGDLPSVERCLKSVLKVEGLNHVILATSTVDEDAVLKDHTYSPAVIFHQGHPEDVIQRYLDVIRKLQLDIIVRITADCPYVENEVFQFLLKSHLENGADYTVAKDAAVGTNLEIMNCAALEKIKRHFPEANYSEYMTWYFQNNPEHFRLNYVDLPAELVRGYRLTLDYQEDLDLFNEIEKHFAEKKLTDFSLRDIWAYLDTHPEAAAINGHLTLKYKTDQALIDMLNKATKIA